VPPAEPTLPVVERSVFKGAVVGYQLLGQYFVLTGRITEEQLKEALAKQAESFQRLGQC
jgi:hypothetical protein